MKHWKKGSIRGESGRIRWALFAAAPFLAAYLVHFTKLGAAATGLLQVDMVYYAAAARSIVEHGNWFSYPNPYDTDPHSPAIYFALPFFLLSLVYRVTRGDIGYLYSAMGVVLGVGLSRATLALVGAVVKESRNVIPLFFIAMWGGGLMTVGAIVVQAPHLFRGGSFNPFVFDPDAGMWLTLWARNIFFAQEAFYHLLVALTLIALVKRRWWGAIAFMGALAASHPWTTIEIFGGIGLWMVLSRFAHRDNAAPLFVWVAFGVIVAAFIWYYAIFLPSYPAYREIRSHYDAPYILPFAWLILSLAPVLIAASFLLLARWKAAVRLSSNELLFGSLFLVSIVLVKHNLFMRPTQPLHFDRGYPWMFLFLFGVQHWERWCNALREWVKAGGLRIAVPVVLGLVLTLDNIAILSSYYRPGEDILTLVSIRPEIRRLYEAAERRNLDGVVASAEPGVMYLAPAYSQLRPYAGHPTNSKDNDSRLQQVRDFFRWDSVVQLPAEIDYLICDWKSLPARQAAEWKVERFEGEFGLYSRHRKAPQSNPP